MQPCSIASDAISSSFARSTRVTDRPDRISTIVAHTMYNMYNQPKKPGGVEQKKIKPWYLPKTPRVPNVMSCQTMIKVGYQLGIKSKETNFFSDPDPVSVPTIL